MNRPGESQPQQYPQDPRAAQWSAAQPFGGPAAPSWHETWAQPIPVQSDYRLGNQEPAGNTRPPIQDPRTGQWIQQGPDGGWYAAQPQNIPYQPQKVQPPLRPYQGWIEASRRHIAGDKVARNALGALAIKTGRIARETILKGAPVAEVGLAIIPGFVEDFINLGIWSAAVRGVIVQRNRMKAERAQ
jgi:hypothetical protein